MNCVSDGIESRSLLLLIRRHESMSDKVELIMLNLDTFAPRGATTN